MNPYRNTHRNTYPRRELSAPGSLPPPYSSPGPHNNPSNTPSLSSTSPSSPVIQTTQTYLTVSSFTAHQAPSAHEAPSLVPSSDCSRLPLPASDQGFSFRSTLSPTSPRVQTGASPSTPNPYAAPSTPPSFQVSVIIPSPDPHLSPPQPRCSEDACPDLECSICFSQFNNIFRCPKMLQCGHTFCLECLARMNVKSTDPEAIQCPLCRRFTPLPALGLPKLTTDSAVLAYLPATMQKVYSIRFQRNKGKLRVKRSSNGHRRWGQRSTLRSMDRSLDVGLPSPTVESGSEAGGVANILFRLTGRPLCRAVLLTAVVLMLVLLTGIVVFLFNFVPERHE